MTTIAITDELLSDLEAKAREATPGPWQWFGNVKMHECYLATVDRGRTFVMDFDRWGMADAQPRFQVRDQCGGIMRKLSEMDAASGPRMVGSHRNDFVGINHPDAAHIAAADPSTILALVAEVRRLRAALEKERRESLMPTEPA